MVVLVLFYAARGSHFLDVRVGRFCGEGSAGAEEDREEAAALPANCPVQGRFIQAASRVDRGAVSDDQ